MTSPYERVSQGFDHGASAMIPWSIAVTFDTLGATCHGQNKAPCGTNILNPKPCHKQLITTPVCSGDIIGWTPHFAWPKSCQSGHPFSMSMACRDAPKEPFMVSFPYLADWARLPHHMGHGMTALDGCSTKICWHDLHDCYHKVANWEPSMCPYVPFWQGIHIMDS